MTVKRSRNVRSSDTGNVLLGETGVVASTTLEEPLALQSTIQRSPMSGAGVWRNWPKVLKPSEQHQRQILALGSPLEEEADVGVDARRHGGGLGYFLEKCYNCKKRFRNGTEIFMYSNLRAFCTAECRAIHIALDKELEKIDGESEESLTLLLGTIKSKDNFG